MIKIFEMKIKEDGIILHDGYKLIKGRRYYGYFKNNGYGSKFIFITPESTKSKRKIMIPHRRGLYEEDRLPSARVASITNVFYVRNKKELKEIIKGINNQFILSRMKREYDKLSKENINE